MDDGSLAGGTAGAELPGTSELTRAERLARRAALTPEDAERALTLLCAELSGLEPERELFRHEWPLRQESAYLVRIESEREDPSPDHRSFTGLFAGRSADRSALMRAVSGVCGRVPARQLGVAVDGAAFAVEKLELHGGVEFSCCGANGRRLFSFGMRLAARFRTTPPRGC